MGINEQLTYMFCLFVCKLSNFIKVPISPEEFLVCFTGEDVFFKNSFAEVALKKCCLKISR